MISRKLTPPPRTEVPNRATLAAALDSFMSMALRRMEVDAEDERTRAMAGLARRHSDAKEAINTILRFADPRLAETVPIETVKAASAVMDNALAELTAFLSENPVPEKPNIDKI